MIESLLRPVTVPFWNLIFMGLLGFVGGFLIERLSR